MNNIVNVLQFYQWDIINIYKELEIFVQHYYYLYLTVNKYANMLSELLNVEFIKVFQISIVII